MTRAAAPFNSCDEAHLRQAIATGGTIRFACSGTITVTNTIDITNSVALDASDYDVIIAITF